MYFHVINDTLFCLDHRSNAGQAAVTRNLTTMVIKILQKFNQLVKILQKFNQLVKHAENRTKYSLTSYF
jgi:hypothetical protein